ncbi:peroxisomal fatty acid beta-oxidation multifunctional protein AIM1-like protein [Tanacetum coccineum]
MYEKNGARDMKKMGGKVMSHHLCYVFWEKDPLKLWSNMIDHVKFIVGTAVLTLEMEALLLADLELLFKRLNKKRLLMLLMYGNAEEVKAFNKLVFSGISKDLAHILFAQRTISKVPKVTDVGLKPRAVISGGGGT